MTKLVALEPMELKTTMPKDVTTGGKRKTKGKKSMKKGMKKSMKKSMKKGMKMKRKTHKKKYLKKKKGGDEQEEANFFHLHGEEHQGEHLNNYRPEKEEKRKRSKQQSYAKYFNGLSKEDQDRELGINN